MKTLPKNATEAQFLAFYPMPEGRLFGRHFKISETYKEEPGDTVPNELVWVTKNEDDNLYYIWWPTALNDSDPDPMEEELTFKELKKYIKVDYEVTYWDLLPLTSFE